MGMFDSLIDERGDEWQTKAFFCALERLEVGDRIGENLPDAYPTTYQVDILGGPYGRDDRDSFATVRDSVLASIDDERDVSLARLNYHGHLVEVALDDPDPTPATQAEVTTPEGVWATEEDER